MLKVCVDMVRKLGMYIHPILVYDGSVYRRQKHLSLINCV